MEAPKTLEEVNELNNELNTVNAQIDALIQRRDEIVGKKSLYDHNIHAAQANALEAEYRKLLGKVCRIRRVDVLHPSERSEGEHFFIPSQIVSNFVAEHNGDIEIIGYHVCIRQNGIDVNESSSIIVSSTSDCKLYKNGEAMLAARLNDYVQSIENDIDNLRTTNSEESN